MLRIVYCWFSVYELFPIPRIFIFTTQLRAVEAFRCWSFEENLSTSKSSCFNLTAFSWLFQVNSRLESRFVIGNLRPDKRQIWNFKVKINVASSSVRKEIAARKFSDGNCLFWGDVKSHSYLLCAIAAYSLGFRCRWALFSLTLFDLPTMMQHKEMNELTRCLSEDAYTSES